VALAVLTGLELTIAFLPWNKTTLVLLLIALAVWKALLVALYYMHLRFERKRLRILAIAPLPFCIIFVTAVLQEHFR
jgi:cytochrome c oxidase subunit 4